MDKGFYLQIIESKIQDVMQQMFPDGTDHTDRRSAQYHLDRVAQYAFRGGQSYTLDNLLTIEDIAERFQITKRRAREIAKSRHERFGIGRKIPGKRGQWLFQPEDWDILTPIEKHRRKDAGN